MRKIIILLFIINISVYAENATQFVIDTKKMILIQEGGEVDNTKDMSRFAYMKGYYIGILEALYTKKNYDRYLELKEHGLTAPEKEAICTNGVTEYQFAKSVIRFADANPSIISEGKSALIWGAMLDYQCKNQFKHNAK